MSPSHSRQWPNSQAFYCSVTDYFLDQHGYIGYSLRLYPIFRIDTHPRFTTITTSQEQQQLSGLSFWGGPRFTSPIFTALRDSPVFHNYH